MRYMAALLILLAAVVGTPAQSRAEFDHTVLERWLCYDSADSDHSEVVVVAERWSQEAGEDTTAGMVQIAGEFNAAIFRINGIDRRWDFGVTEESIAEFAFIVRDTGHAAYYDLTEAERDERVGPTRRFTCELAEEHPSDSDVELDEAVASADLRHYQMALVQHVQRNWVMPATVTDDLECIANIRQLPNGEVVSVDVVQCNGDDTVVRSIVDAIERASPLPLPSDPSLFLEEFLFRFTRPD